MSRTSLPSQKLRTLASFFSTGSGGLGLAANCSPARIVPRKPKRTAKVNPAMGRSALDKVAEIGLNMILLKRRVLRWSDRTASLVKVEVLVGVIGFSTTNFSK